MTGICTRPVCSACSRSTAAARSGPFRWTSASSAWSWRATKAKVLGFLGWETADAAALDALAARLEANGVEVNSAPRSLDHIKIVLTVEG